MCTKSVSHTLMDEPHEARWHNWWRLHPALSNKLTLFLLRSCKKPLEQCVKNRIIN